MKKTLFTLIILTGIISICRAQTKSPALVSIGPEIGAPTGQASDVYSLVVGASLKVQVPLAQSPFNFIIAAGFSNFVVNSRYSGYFQDAAYVPVVVGLRVYFHSIVYVEGDFGESFNVNDNYTGPKSAFVYSPVLGFSQPARHGNGGVDVGIKYEGRTEPGGTVGQIAVRVAYRFSTK